MEFAYKKNAENMICLNMYFSLLMTPVKMELAFFFNSEPWVVEGMFLEVCLSLVQCEMFWEMPI